MTAPRMCEICGRKPEAYIKRRWCYDCKPGAKGRPLPCKKCGTSGDYWTQRLCRRCHRYGPYIDSCPDCLAWGTTRIRNWVCAACTGWRHDHPQRGTCICCRRELNLNEHQACRLCWSQTIAQAQAGEPRDVLAANRFGQQLWLANMASPKNGYRPHPRRDFRRRRHQINDAPVRDDREAYSRSVSAVADPGQLSLFARDRVVDAVQRLGFDDPPNLRFAILLDDHVQDRAECYGWSERQTRNVRITLRAVQARYRLRSAPIQASEVLSMVEQGLDVRLALVVLEDHGLLDDDRVATVPAWFARKTADLPAPMRQEMQTWFDILHDGSTTPPRSRPRTIGTIKIRAQWAVPTLHRWAEEGHESLREITRDDVLAVLPPRGTPRAKLGSALRSIFTTLKRHGLLFTNPTARIQTGQLERTVPMPLDPALIRAAFDSEDPATAAITALIGVHGLRPVEACTLLLTDVRDHRIHLADRVIYLADAAKIRLDTYLAERYRRWPASINPHFLVHSRSAATLEEVRVPWLTDKLGMRASDLRRDRILAEVEAGGDQRRLCDFFGFTMDTAQYYAATLNHPDLDTFTTVPSGS